MTFTKKFGFFHYGIPFHKDRKNPMSEIEINFTLKFNISETDFNVKDLFLGVKDTNSQIMLGISNQLLQKFLLSLEKPFYPFRRK